MENPTSAAAESIRGRGARLVNDKDRQSPLCLQFVSAEPEEGKSSVVASFACMQAKAGRKVLLIDADLRHPRVARLLGLQNAQGLVDVLAGRALVTDVVQHHEASGADVLPAGRLPRSAFDILNVRRLQELLRPLRERYDLILIDSPPALSLADAGVIASAVDGSVFLVRWGSTRKETARFATSQIEASGGRVVGVVLTFINVRRAATYAFGDAGLYYGKHQKYYVN
jgi:capsular exopolysaccharide synthesis family protein